MQFKSCIVHKLSLIIAALLFIGCGESKEVQIVKNGHLNSHPEKTIGEAVDNFVGNPKWESGIGADGETKGKTLVNVRGKMMFMGKEVTGALQYIVNTKESTFEINAFEINEVPQNMFILAGLIEKMYESNPKKAALTDSKSNPIVSSDIKELSMEFQKADKEINTVYKDVMSKLSSGVRGELKREQIAWIKKKESTCDAEGDEVKRLQCMIRMTNERTEELKKYPAN